MKKRLFTVLVAVVTALLVLAFSGCNKYTSSYKATAMVKTSSTKSASMSFSSFEGTMVFKLKCGSDDEQISYSAKLENGSAKIYYDCNGTKTELLSVTGGDDVSGLAGELQKGTVYIIVETSETGKDGRFGFEIKQP